MTVKSSIQKVEILNPNTGGSMRIDKDIYDIISKAIRHSLRNGKALTFSEIVEDVYAYLEKKKIVFSRSVEWYSISIKNDMEARGWIESFTEKGRKLNRMVK